jgi:hypothetical protein
VIRFRIKRSAYGVQFPITHLLPLALRNVACILVTSMPLSPARWTGDEIVAAETVGGCCRWSRAGVFSLSFTVGHLSFRGRTIADGGTSLCPSLRGDRQNPSVAVRQQDSHRIARKRLATLCPEIGPAYSFSSFPLLKRKTFHSSSFFGR